MKGTSYCIMQFSLTTKRKIYGAKNGEAKIFDLGLNRVLQELDLPQEKIEIGIPFAIPCISEKPETTLEIFYTEIILRGLISTLPLKACVIADDVNEFRNRLGQFNSYKELEEVGGVTVDELIACQLWKFLAVLAGNFTHLPDVIRVPAIALIKKEAPQYTALTKKVLSA